MTLTLYNNSLGMHFTENGNHFVIAEQAFIN